MAWRVVGRSMCGASHIRTDQACQDAHLWRILPDGGLIIAVSDGAGSAEHGAVGSGIAVESAVHFLAECHSGGVTADSLVAAAGEVRKCLEFAAQSRAVRLETLACTLIIVHITDDMTRAVQVGDGAAVVRPESGALAALTTPRRGEFVNETIFLTSSSGLAELQCVEVPGRTADVAVLTDGLESISLRFTTGEPHAGFFVPVFDLLRQEHNAALVDQALAEFLASDRVRARTDDDVTLVIATAVREDPETSELSERSGL